MVGLVSYYLINLKYPEVRSQEYLTIDNKNIYSATQFPVEDPCIKLKRNNKVGLSFINLHHKSDEQIKLIIDSVPFHTLHIFEIAKDSIQSYFLDTFISKYKTQKHNGNYIEVSKFNNVVEYSTLNYKWYLKESIAVEYLSQLFRLDKEPSLELLRMLNYNGETFDWSLDYIKLEKEQ